MRILIAPDKFKGTLTAAEVTEAVNKGIIKNNSEIETALFPLADGGEGKFKKKFSDIPGTGAAGGLGAACLLFLNAKIQKGTETVFKLTNFEEKLKNSDLIITGEGRIDSQTFTGKLIHGILKLAKKHKKPVAVICGVCDISEKELKKQGLLIIKTLCSEYIPDKISLNRYSELITSKTDEIINEFRLGNCNYSDVIIKPL